MLRAAPRLLALMALVALAACGTPDPPITVEQGMITVVNQTEQDWSDVLITVNDHFRGFVPVLKAEGRANAPLSQFTTGHGQRWSSGAHVKTVDVAAKGADGSEVKLSWGREREGDSR
jgi:hypothetical protein